MGRLHNPLAGALAAARLTSMAMKNPATMMPLIVPAMSASKTTVDIDAQLSNCVIRVISRLPMRIRKPAMPSST